MLVQRVDLVARVIVMVVHDGVSGGDSHPAGPRPIRVVSAGAADRTRSCWGMLPPHSENCMRELVNELATTGRVKAVSSRVMWR